MSLSLRKIQDILLATAESSPGIGSGTGNTGVKPEMSKDDIIDFLDKDDEPINLDKDKKEPEKKAKGDKGEEEEDDKPVEDEDELKELEDELEDEEEPDDEKLEISSPVSRREILKAYPDLFKKFPYLEKAYYREQQFTKLFATPKDAEEVVEKAQILDNFEADLVKGDTEKILKSIKDSDSKSFAKVVDSYMETLAKVDNNAYQHVLGNTLRHTIIAMVNEAKESGNEALQHAAVLLNQFAFGSSKFTPPSKLAPAEKQEDNTKEKEISERERQFNQRRFESADDEVSTRIDNKFKATIAANIDPKDSMTDFVKRNAIRDATEELEKLIGTDDRFKMLIDKLWENAYKNDFSREAVSKIEQAFISKARTLLPSVIKKARNEALRGMGKRVVGDKEKDNDEETRPRKKVSNDDESRPRRKESNDSKDRFKGMTIYEAMMADD